jgi:hypothetical protein
MQSVIATISLELDILNDQLKRFGSTECEHRCKEHQGKCDYFVNAGKSFADPFICSIDNCPLLDAVLE